MFFRSFQILLAVIGAALSVSPQAQSAEFPQFEHVTIDPHCGDVCYAVTLADVNGDEKPDIVVVTEDQVVWYQNPAWIKGIIVDGQTVRDNVCIAPHDIDGDGQVDFALGAGWPNKGGTIQWLSRGSSLDETWNVHLIGEEPSLHRMRFADVLGTGKPQLVISPLNKHEGDGVKLTAFQIPDDPRKDRWPATIMDQSLNRMHNHWHVDFDRDGIVDTLTASEEGLHVIQREDMEFRRVALNNHAAGEVKTGQLKDRRFIATIEPMHGNTVALYVESPDGRRLERNVLDETLGRGHAVWTADVDNDGADELIIGHSDSASGEIKGPGIYIYDAQNETGTKWTKHVVDNGGMATEDAIAGDVNGDGWVDIVAGGRSTHNVKLYVNRGTK